MSAVFKKPKVRTIEPKEVDLDFVEPVIPMINLERKRQKKMGALSQMLSHDNSYSSSYDKLTLGR